MKESVKVDVSTLTHKNILREWLFISKPGDCLFGEGISGWKKNSKSNKFLRILFMG